MITELISSTLFEATEGKSIWKLLVSPQGVLIGEERDVERRLTSFFAYNLQAKQLLWSDVKLSELWWLSVLEVTCDSLYIQHYAQGPLPTPSGVSRIDLNTGLVAWTIPGVAYHSETDDEVILLQQGMMREHFFAANRSTGEITRGLDASEVQLASPPQHLTFASLTEPQDINHKLWLALLEGFTALDEIRGMVEYLERDELTVLSYYSRDTKDAQSMLENRLVQRLLIVDSAHDAVLFSEEINRSANYPITGSYFLFQDQLLYVKESSELKSIAI